MAILGKAGYTNALKFLYKAGLPDTFYGTSPLLSLMRKDTSFEGDAFKQRVQYGGIGGSTVFATAQLNQGVPAIADFSVDMGEDYTLGSIDEKTIRRTKSNRGAQARALDTMVQSANYEAQQSLACQLWCNGGGARARLSATAAIATPTVLLATPTDVVKFEVGMYCVTSVTDGTNPAGVTKPGRVQITGINRNTGALTIAGNWNAAGNIPTVAVSDYITREDDFAHANPGTSTRVVTGVLGWCPIAAPGVALFWGVNRTADTAKLAGSQVAGAAMPITEAAFEGRAEAKLIGGSPDIAFINPRKFMEFEKDVYSKTVFAVDLKGSNPKINVKGVGIHGPTSDIVFVQDYMCPFDVMFMTKMDTWTLMSIDAAPHFKKQSGDMLVWDIAADAKGFRLASYANPVCSSPKDTVVVNL